MRTHPPRRSTSPLLVALILVALLAASADRGLASDNCGKHGDSNCYPAETKIRPQKRVRLLLSPPFQFGHGHRAENWNGLRGRLNLLAHFLVAHSCKVGSELRVSFICHGGTIQRPWRSGTPS